MADVTVAVVVATSPDALEVVGGLPLAVRAVLALRAAGTTDIGVFAGSQAAAVRAALDRRGLEVHWVTTAADVGRLPGLGPVRVLAGDTLVDADGVARAMTCPRAALPPLLAEMEVRASLTEALRRVGVTHEPRPGEGLFVALDASHPPAALEAALLAHLGRHTQAGDSYLAAVIDRRLSRPLTRLLLRWPVTPSQITGASILFGLVGAAGLTTVSYAGRVGGVLALIGSIVLDCVDGEVARTRIEQSAAGAKLDLIGDYTVHLATFLGLGIGLVRQGLGPAAAWAAGALVGGVFAAMATVHLLFIRPALSRGGDLHWTGDADSLRGTPLAAVVEKLASRDYTYLLLVSALAGHLDWFVYAAAFGSWAFVAGLLGYWGVHRASRRRAAVAQ